MRRLVAAVLALAACTAGAADLEAGKKKAALCEACHGPEGNSVVPANPSIAGQPAQFIATALYFFREGNRKDALMSPIAAQLSNVDMNDLAAYFATTRRTPKHKASAESAAAGPALSQQFMCTQCHGPELKGTQHIPGLAGQQYEYLSKQLALFKAKQRADIDGNMTSAAQALGEKEIHILADYIAGLGAP